MVGTKIARHTDPKFDAEGPLRIDSVEVKWIQDESPDLSWIGKYTNDHDPYAIVAVGQHAGEFAVDVPDDELPGMGREYRYFVPYAGGEELGSAEYRTYGKQDYELMVAYYRGDWCSQGCVASAKVSYPIGGGSRRLEWFKSGGLWGIESGDKEYLAGVEEEQLADLVEHLGHFAIWTTVGELRRKMKGN